MPYGITQCYLPPGSGDIPASTPAKAGNRFSDPGGMQGWVDQGGWLEYTVKLSELRQAGSQQICVNVHGPSGGVMWAEVIEKLDSVVVKVKVKVNVDLYSALSWTYSKALRYGTRSQGISQFYLHTPRSSANGMNHTCLCLPSRSWYSFTDPGGMEGWVGLGWLVGYILK